MVEQQCADHDIKPLWQFVAQAVVLQKLQSIPIARQNQATSRVPRMFTGRLTEIATHSVKRHAGLNRASTQVNEDIATPATHIQHAQSLR
jgi:hypothetical protein